MAFVASLNEPEAAMSVEALARAEVSIWAQRSASSRLASASEV